MGKFLLVQIAPTEITSRITNTFGHTPEKTSLTKQLVSEKGAIADKFYCIGAHFIKQKKVRCR